MYEVEQKFRIQSKESLRDALLKLGAEHQHTSEQVDIYFGHPSRDFAATDEALRIRRDGDLCCITYKGPKIDDSTKTRAEIELPLPAGLRTVEDFSGLLETLGFARVTEVMKTRQKYRVVWQERAVEAVIDEVRNVGQFVELELTADGDGVASAKDCLSSLSIALGLTGNERRSYLELLLASRGASASSPGEDG